MSSWAKSWGASWGGSWGAITVAPAEVIVDEGGWVGEWLPIPVPKSLEPAPIPGRRVKLHGKAPKPATSATLVSIPRRTVSASLVVHDGPISEITCRVDRSVVDDEDAIIAAMAAFL